MSCLKSSMTLVSRQSKMKSLSSTLVVLLGLFCLLKSIPLHQFYLLRNTRNTLGHKSLKTNTIEGASQAKGLSPAPAQELEGVISIPSLQKRLSSPSSKRLTKGASYPTLNVSLGSGALNTTRVTQRLSKSESTSSLRGPKHETKSMTLFQRSEKSSSGPFSTSSKSREL
jgi:hypothetical protein